MCVCVCVCARARARVRLSAIISSELRPMARRNDKLRISGFMAERLQIKYMEVILSYSTRKLLWRESINMLIAVFKNYCVIYFNFRHTFVPY